MLIHYLDDLREPPAEYHEMGKVLTFRNPYQFLFFARNAQPEDLLSLDHDLGQDEHGVELPSGYAILSVLEKQFMTEEIWTRGMPNIQIHSDNPVGIQNMKTVITQMRKFENRQRPG